MRFLGLVALIGLFLSIVDASAASADQCPARESPIVLLVAATSATVLWSGGTAHSGPCAVQIARLEGQIQRAAPSPENGPTAPQSVAGQLHHQPTPDSVQNAERNARLAAAAALDRLRQADVDGNAVACAKALDEAKQLDHSPFKLTRGG